MSLAELLNPPPPPPGVKLRRSYQTRRRRLDGLEVGNRRATAHVRKRLGEQSFSEIRIRPSFVCRTDPSSSVSTFDDRTLPPKAERPPCTRLLSPRGVALKFELIALLQAQIAAGGRAGGRPNLQLALKPGGAETGWVDLIAADAELSPESAKWVVSPRTKRREIVKSALRALQAQGLVEFLPGGKSSDKYERFVLLNEGGIQSDKDNEPYTLPGRAENVLSLPVTFFTNGWVNILADTEIAFVLMLCDMRRLAADAAVHQQISSRERLHGYGMGRDAYSGAHRMLAAVGLVDLIADPDRHGDGKVADFNSKDFVPPHKFQLLVDGFNEDAFSKIKDHLDSELRRPAPKIRIPPGNVRFVETDTAAP